MVDLKRFKRPGELVKRYGLDWGTLLKWSKRCRWLPGKRVVRTRPNPNSQFRLYCESDVAAAVSAMNAAREQVGDLHQVNDRLSDGGGEWWSVSKAAGAVGVRPDTIKRWARDGCPWNNGWRPRSRRVPRLPGGFARYVLAADVRLIMDSQQGEKSHFRRSAEHGVWIEVEEVCSRLSVGPTTVDYWRRTGCPALGGGVIASRQVISIFGHKRNQYLASDVSTIARVIESHPAEFSDEAGNWLQIDHAAKLRGVSSSTLWGWSRDGDPVTKLPLRWKRAIGRAGRCHVSQKRFVHAGDLDAIFRRRAEERQPNRSPAELSIREVAGELGVASVTACKWLTRGCPYKEGANLAGVKRSVNGKKRKQWFIHRDEVEKIRLAMAARADAGRECEPGKLTVTQAAAVWGIARATAVAWVKACPSKDGKGLDAEKRALPGTRKPIWLIPIEEVESVKEAMRAPASEAPAPTEPAAAVETPPAEGNGRAGGNGSRRHAGGRPAQWEELRAMIRDAEAKKPRPTAGEICREYRIKFGRSISEQKRKAATPKTVKNLRYELRQAGEI